jgi:cysteine synthase A
MMNNVIDKLVGNTPVIQISDRLYAKVETYNPSGSIKDRLALFLLTEAEKRGELKPGDTIVEATSGNTGIAFSMLGAAKGYKVKIVMPRNMSEERKQMIRLYGAEIIEVDDSDFRGAITLRDEMVSKNKAYWAPRQFENKDNIKCHYKTTAREIGRWLSSSGNKYRLSAFISGAGTGGTIMGCGKYFKQQWPESKIVLVRPAEDAKNHGIQGINDGEDFLCDMSKVDEVIEIQTCEAIKRAKRLASESGLLVGISAGANILASERWIEAHDPVYPIMTILCDRGERYMTIY